MAIRRIIAYSGGPDAAAARAFYAGVLGMEVGMEGPVLGFHPPGEASAQVIVDTLDDPRPSIGIDLGTPEAVDAAHAEARRRGMRIAYGPADEPWGIRRFFVEDPGGTLVSVLAHLPQ